jgi:hypothetical protein
MGKGKIISGGPLGLYRVELVRDVARIEHKILELMQLISSFTTEILLTLEPASALAETAKDAALIALNTVISDYQAGTATKEQVDAAIKEYALKLYLYQKALKNLQLKQIEKAGLEKRLEALKFPAENPIVSAWCADLTANLAGNVGTIEIPGERGSVNIQAGYSGGAVYDADTDGILQPVIAGTPANVFGNLAMLPGWQKFKPTYRTGRITAFSTDMLTCSISLDQAISSQQNLAINQSNKLWNVPFDYMGCSSTAFDISDRVIIKFINQDWSKPQIIGFASSPKPGRICIKLTIDLPGYPYGMVLTPAYNVEIFVLNYFNYIPGSGYGWGDPLDITYKFDTLTQYWKITISNPDSFITGWLFYRCNIWCPSNPYTWYSYSVQYPNDTIIHEPYQKDKIGYGYYIDLFTD